MALLGAETCSNLIPVVDCILWLAFCRILLSAYVG
jgi:hypothetical protein